jgi:hypothetical protein
MYCSVNDPFINIGSNLILVEAKEVQTVLLNLSICVDDVFLEEQARMMQDVILALSMMEQK